MRRIVVVLMVAGLAACTRAPAPAEPASAPAPAAAPATVADAPADAPPSSGVVGARCMPEPGATPAPDFLPDSPAGVVQHFYELHAPHAGAGAPEADQLATYAPLLTKDLVAALERARAERDRAIADNPGEKPPFVEGALFASLFEGYTRALPRTVASEGDTARVPVCFQFLSKGMPVEWIDTVRLRREDGAWRIDDVAYGGQWDFANSGTLREQLPAGE
jgi:hypothetical protein